MSKPICVKFSKYEGAGNDFIVIDDRPLFFPIDPVEIRRLCHRKFGIGADGIILLSLPSPDIPADFRMRIFNSDGSEAESCGNGLRCLGKFLTELGLLVLECKIAIHNRIVPISIRNAEVEVDMGEPKDLSLHLSAGPHTVHFIDTGVPHAVLFTDDIDQAPVDTLGPTLRSHPLFSPKGANVNFASLEPDNSLRIRTFERGVEKETLACGTGACAVAHIAKALYSLPESILCRFAGGEMTVTAMSGNLKLAGPAAKVFEGTVHLN